MNTHLENTHRHRFPVSQSAWLAMVSLAALLLAIGIVPLCADDSLPSPATTAGPVTSLNAANPTETANSTDSPQRAEAKGHRVVDFELTDQQGRKVTLETLAGKPWVASFIYASCQTHCPATLREIFEMNRALAAQKEVRFVTITVDPEHDTVQKLAALSDVYVDDPDRWLMLTGERKEIEHLIRFGFGQPVSTNAMQLAHSLNLMHVDADGIVQGQYRYDYQTKGAGKELNELTLVLKGRQPTPEANRFQFNAIAAGIDAAAGGNDSGNVNTGGTGSTTPATTPSTDTSSTSPSTVDVPPIVLQPMEESPLPKLEPGVPVDLPDFFLTDHLNRPVTKETFLGQPWVVNFIYGSCQTHCPATMREIQELNRRLANVDVRFVTITVNPEQDTVENLSILAKQYGADGERWRLLTGAFIDIRELIEKGFHQPVVDTSRMLLVHSLNLMQVDAEGRVVGVYRYAYQTDHATDELNNLALVLQGRMEIPDENRYPPLPTTSDPRLTPSTRGDAPKLLVEIPAWVDALRSANALLNGIATLLLLAGIWAIKSKRPDLHKQLMLAAFVTSIAFLVCYLSYHAGLKHYTGQGHKPYAGAESLATLYRVILWTHIPLAALVPGLAIVTIRRGLRQNWEGHRKLAKITFPIWLYVSVTGVIIYWMN
ncbi:MAG: DUF420 domain-containing protein [Planctomycetaceae bacterium]